jgi:hypothetical protein
LRFACVVPEVTIRTTVPLIEPDVAVIVASPTEPAVARPEVLTPSTPELDDVHELEEVRFCVLPSV